MGSTVAFVPVTVTAAATSPLQPKCIRFVASDNIMTDEVAAAKAAAAEYKSSDTDGAGPSTVFDNLLSGKWPSNKVHEDDLSLAFRKWMLK